MIGNLIVFNLIYLHNNKKRLVISLTDTIKLAKIYITSNINYLINISEL